MTAARAGPSGAPKNAEPGIPVAASIVWGVLVWPGIVMTLFTPTLFDAPGYASNLRAWLMAGVVLSFPLLCVASIAGSWIAWSLTRGAPSRMGTIVQAVFACLPSLHVLLLMGGLLFWTFGTPTTLQLHETTY